MKFFQVSNKRKLTHEAEKAKVSLINVFPNLEILEIILDRLLLINV